jgi:hypothetical protein
LDTNSYPTGIHIPDRQMAALPLARHDWHGQWNYTLHPIAHPGAEANQPPPFDRPSPHLAWLRHPVITGLAQDDFDTLITTLVEVHHAQHEADLEKRRGHRRRTGQGTGHHAGLTLADRYLATMLYQRHQLTQAVIAELFTVHPVTINKHTAEMRRLLAAADHQITPIRDDRGTLNDLYQLAADAGITPPHQP